MIIEDLHKAFGPQKSSKMLVVDRSNPLIGKVFNKRNYPIIYPDVKIKDVIKDPDSGNEWRVIKESENIFWLLRNKWGTEERVYKSSINGPWIFQKTLIV
jgi:hypothetical protein